MDRLPLCTVTVSPHFVRILTTLLDLSLSLSLLRVKCKWICECTMSCVCCDLVGLREGGGGDVHVFH